MATDATDVELLEGWGRGDNAAGEELVARHFSAVCRFFKNKVDSAVDDLVQDVFLRCLDSRERFRGESSFRTFLFAIARNVLYMHYRKNSRNPIDFMSMSAVDLGASPSQQAAHKQEQRLLLAALRAIPIDYQIALELYYWEGLKGPELAAILEISAHTVRSRLHRARKALEEAMTTLATSPGVLETTLSDLEGWARSLREKVA